MPQERTMLEALHAHGLNVYTPFDQIPLSPQERAVYQHLVRRAGSKDYAWPSHETIAVACRMSINGVKKAIEDLIEIGLILKRSKAGQTTNYHILGPNAVRRDVGERRFAETRSRMNLKPGAMLEYLEYIPAEEREEIRRLGEIESRKRSDLEPAKETEGQPLGSEGVATSWLGGRPQEATKVVKENLVKGKALQAESHFSNENEIQKSVSLLEDQTLETFIGTGSLSGLMGETPLSSEANLIGIIPSTDQVHTAPGLSRGLLHMHVGPRKPKAESRLTKILESDEADRPGAPQSPPNPPRDRETGRRTEGRNGASRDRRGQEGRSKPDGGSEQGSGNSKGLKTDLRSYRIGGFPPILGLPEHELISRALEHADPCSLATDDFWRAAFKTLNDQSFTFKNEWTGYILGRIDLVKSQLVADFRSKFASHIRSRLYAVRVDVGFELHETLFGTSKIDGSTYPENDYRLAVRVMDAEEFAARKDEFRFHLEGDYPRLRVLQLLAHYEGYPIPHAAAVSPKEVYG